VSTHGSPTLVQGRLTRRGMARVAGVEASAVPGRITGEQSLRGNSFVKMRSLAPGPLVLHTSSANTEIVHERRRRRGPASAGLVTRAQQMVPADSSAPSAIPAPPWTPRFLILGEGARLSRRAAPTRHSARQAASRCCLGAQRDGRACEPAGVTEVLVLTSRIRTTPERLFDLSLDMAATGCGTSGNSPGLASRNSPWGPLCRLVGGGLLVVGSG